MAQAARLSLRMQKELRLLLSDPPPGATFPSLSADFDLASLSSIDAQIEGPEGTVYSTGIFKIKIQIPERYPFQPPIVTFATPIYHPNIDNGGRICLDILNLPPKGSWQPSLNVSTVLTSIRLLLSEPNPDDGLMLEASREYKYNRQDFDLKARSMTEKFANGGAGENSCSNQSTQPTPNASLLESRDLMKKYASVGDKRPSGTTKTLSLEPSDSISNGASKFEANEMPKQPLYAFGSENVTGDKGKRKVATGVLEDNNLGYSKLKGARRKLSLASSGQLQKDNDDNKENIDPNCPPSFCPPQAISVGFSSLVLQDTTNGDKRLNDYQNGWKQCQKQTEVSPALLQPSDGKDENILLSNQPGSQPIKPQRGSSVLMSAGTNSKTSSLAGKKKLALGLKATSDRSTLLKPKSPHNKTGLSNTALLPQQENGSHSRTLSPDNLSVDECKCLPTHADHRHNEKQQSDKEQNKKMGEETKQKATELEEEEFPVPESTIVLDSEESEEEERGSSRLRLSIGRKGIVKQRAKT